MSIPLSKYFKDTPEGHFIFNYRGCPNLWIFEHLHHSDDNGYYYCRRKAINRPLEYCEVYGASIDLGLKHSYNLLYRNIAHPNFDPRYKSSSDRPEEGFYFCTPEDYNNEEEYQKYEAIWDKLRENAYKELKPILDKWVANHNPVKRFPIRVCDTEELLERYIEETKIK